MTVKTLSLGELQTNCYILTDDETSSAIIIDPGAESENTSYLPILTLTIQVHLMISKNTPMQKS